MARLRTLAAGSSLALAGAAIGIFPAAATAGASGTARPAAPFQSAACGAAPAGYSTCLVHVWHHGTPATAGPQRHHGTTTGGSQSSTPSGNSPTAIAKAYGFTATGGTGETIAVVDAFGAPTITSNLRTFDSQYGLTGGSFAKVNQTGGSTYPRTTKGWALETSLDVEWAHALAPEAHVLLVEATSNSNANLFAAVTYAAKHATYVSMSWGGTEASSELTYDSYFTSHSTVSFFAAAGDSASAVIYPSSSPDVISVGGTTLRVKSTGASAGTSAWSTAGGGCSRYEKATRAQATFPTYGQVTCAGMRATPDFSLDANPSTGVAVYDTERVTGLSGWIQVGGTSASTVMVASHAADIAKKVDATVAYGSSLDFYDVTSGSNGHPCELGYDLCTGLGSWNTAAGGVNTAPVGSLSFTATSASATAGSPVQLSVSLTPAQTTPVPVKLSTTKGGFSTTKTGTYSSTLTLTVSAGSTSASFWYEDTSAGTATLTASSSTWTSATMSVTVGSTGTTTSSMTVTVTAGATVHHGHTYHVPLTVTATSTATAGAVGGAGVTLDVYSGTTCTGSPVASGTATTSTAGTASFSFSTQAAAAYCAMATVTASDYTTGTGTATFST